MQIFVKNSQTMPEIIWIYLSPKIIKSLLTFCLEIFFLSPCPLSSWHQKKLHLFWANSKARLFWCKLHIFCYSRATFLMEQIITYSIEHLCGLTVFLTKWILTDWVRSGDRFSSIPHPQTQSILLLFTSHIQKRPLSTSNNFFYNHLFVV